MNTATRPSMNAQQMRHAILNDCKAGSVPVTGDLWFSLVFRTEAELRKICHAMGIDTWERQ